MQNGPGQPAVVTLSAGPPAWALAAVMPLAALGLIWFRSSDSGLSSTPSDPVSPLVMAVVTLVAVAVLAWRSVTQRAALDEDGLHCRNLTMSFHVEWERIERLELVHRGGLQMVEVRVRGLRRHNRLGAATRFSG
ncbi:MAG: hypothetical protein WCJ04_07060, partial [Actinomycetes bacterium]